MGYGPVLVTGATGFLGWHLTDACARRGAAVRGLVRNTAAALPVGVEPVLCSDLTDRHAVRRGVSGAATVVHLAARAHVTRERHRDALGEFRRSNVEGTRVLLEEALRAGVQHFVLVSSVGAICQQSDTVITERTAPRPVGAYGQSKLEAEDVVQTLATGVPLHVTILRPPMIYGPGMRGNPARLFTLVDRGVPLPLASVRNRRSMLYVGNFVAAALAVLDMEGTGVETFVVSDAGEFSTPEFIRRIAQALGRPARLFPLAPAFLYAGGRVGDALSRIVPLPFTSHALLALTGSLVVDAAAFRKRTGFMPPYTPDDGLRATAAWYRAPSPEPSRR